MTGKQGQALSFSGTEYVSVPYAASLSLQSFTVSTWVNLQVSRNAGKEVALVGAALAILGLMPTLFVRRRRVWVRVRSSATDEPLPSVAASASPPATVAAVAGLDRVASGDAGELDDELAAIAADIEKELA